MLLAPAAGSAAAARVASVRGFLVVNPRSGNGRPSADELAAEAERLGVKVHMLEEGQDPAEAAREADGVPLGVAGGDGSLGTVAQVAIERDVPFAVVPFGTRNHFARDVGLDRDDPLAALSAFAGGEERRVDVGRVNGRVFLNNLALGLYARLVHRREGGRRRREALARLRALWLTATERAGPTLFAIDGAPVHARVLLVANNDYRLDPLSLGTRESLDEGRLHLYVANGLGDGWDERAAERLTIDWRGPRVRAALDGEPAELQTPLDVAVDPGALRLLVPRAAT